MVRILDRGQRQDQKQNGEVGSLPLFGNFWIIPAALRELAWHIHKILGVKRSRVELSLGHGHRAQVIAEHVSKVAGASLVWCSRDGKPLTAIVHANGHGTEVVGLACLNCHSFIATPSGVLGKQRGGSPGVLAEA
jgi:hypothetical protein